MEQKKYFEVTVGGQYIALSMATGTQTLKAYEEKFVLLSQEAALSKICKHLLSPRLKKKYPDFIKYRTHEKLAVKLFNYTPDTGVLQMSIEDMNLTELGDFCILRGLEIDPFLHGHKDIFALRQIVMKANEDKRQYAKDRATSKTAPAEKEADTLRRMNDVEAPKAGLEINPNEQLVKKAGEQAPPVETSATPAADEPIESEDALPPPEPESADDPFAN